MRVEAIMLLTAFTAVSARPARAAGGHAAPPAEESWITPAMVKQAFVGVSRAEVKFPGGRVIAAEIADTPERVTYGYMFRTEVRDDDGMIFVFADPDVHAFWMKNTLVPLDIVWLDDKFNVVYIQSATPPCKSDPCPSYGSLRKASYVLELKSGVAGREGLKAGSRLGVTFPGGVSGGTR
jgi:uncharacterized membrane protein (UPF0127 family)